MRRGTLEVILVSAKGIANTDVLSTKQGLIEQEYINFIRSKIEPYVILSYRTQEHRSSVAKGSDSRWNESFLFTISDNFSELHLKLMDKDTFNQDDYLGEARIPLEAVFVEGSIPETAYNVVKEQDYCGEVRVALIFNPEMS